MSSDGHKNTEVPREEYVEEGHFFDQLARGIANGTLSRGQVLKLAGAAVLGSLLGNAFSGVAVAKKKKKKKKHKRLPAPCSAVNPTGVCPSGQRCVSGTCVCDSTSCPNGCCVNGKCHVRDPQFCGTDGGYCSVCATGQPCFSGKCGSVQTCFYQNICWQSSCGDGNYCLQTTEGEYICKCGATYGGECTSSSQCPDGTFCVQMDQGPNAVCNAINDRTLCVTPC